MAIKRHSLVLAIVIHMVLMAVSGCTQESAETKATHHRERAIAYFDKGEYREATRRAQARRSNRPERSRRPLSIWLLPI